MDAIANLGSKSRIETFVSPGRRHSGGVKVQPVETVFERAASPLSNDGAAGLR
jgi:hypothetical protein